MKLIPLTETMKKLLLRKFSKSRFLVPVLFIAWAPVEAVGTYQLELAWNHSAFARSYTLWQSYNSGPFMRIISSINSNTVLVPITKEGTYRYYVTAVNEWHGDSGPSNIVTKTIRRRNLHNI